MSKKDKPKVHKDLQGYEVKIDKFGQITSNLDVDKLNDFLNKKTTDKKLKKRKDK